MYKCLFECFFLVAKVKFVIKIELYLRLAEGIGDKEASRQLEIEAEEEGAAGLSSAIHGEDYVSCCEHGWGNYQ